MIFIYLNGLLLIENYEFYFLNIYGEDIYTMTFVCDLKIGNTIDIVKFTDGKTVPERFSYKVIKYIPQGDAFSREEHQLLNSSEEKKEKE